MRVLADTSVWVGHLRAGDEDLGALLNQAQVLIHPFVIGELACGNLSQRAELLALLKSLPGINVANDDEVLFFIEQHALMGRGIGYVDVHLLASVALESEARLWTRDKRLDSVAADLGMT